MPPKKSRRRPAKPANNATTGNAASARPTRGAPTHRPDPPEPSTTAARAAPPEAEEHPSALCSVCAERARDWAVGECAHVVCGNCSHRMRALYERQTCVMCAATLRQVAVVPLRDYRPAMTFADAAALPGAFQDRAVAMWFVDRSRATLLKRLRGWMCSHKACAGKGAQESVFANPAQLRAHVRAEHRAVYCEVCFAGRRCFVAEMQLYTLDPDRNYSSRLRGHLRKEHPQCRFCRHYFLDDEKLYAHLQEHHETCSICERNGRMHEYYVNFEQLENHYEKEHYVCRDEACRGVVFATQIELQTHEHSRHNDNPRSARARALRVNLQQLHGDRDARRRDFESPRDVRIEQERQAARRQAFLSSNVVFSGALNFDDASASAVDGAGSSTQPYASSQARGSSSSATPLPPPSNVAAEVPRRPDDGHFYPLELPRDSEELQSRNTMLVRSMRSLLDPAAYEQFRMSSGQFHSGKITSDEYYDAVTDAFGVRAAIRDILPELVALLPTPLLREPLLQTCLQRTATKPNDVGYLGPPVSGAAASAAPSGSGRVQDEQFPSLSGAPTPVRAPPPSMRRFGTPGPEEFPRLGRVNKPQGALAAASGSSKASSSSNPSSSRSAASSTPAASPRPASAQSQRTVAAVLRQAPPPAVRAQHVDRQPRGNGAVGQSAANGGAQLSPNAFPSLTSSTAPSPTVSMSEKNWSSDPEASSSASEAPPTDVSMRVGPVWGGVTARAHNRGSKKRGPGRGLGRTPASPPKRVLLGSSDLPDIRSGSQSENASSASEDQGSRGNLRQANVIDVMEIAKSRRGAVQKSNLPKVGGSGYGFAWDRKKVQQKKKQIKNDVGQSSTSRSDAGPSNSFVPSARTEVTTNSMLNTDVIEPAEEEEGAALAKRFGDVDIHETGGNAQPAKEEPTEFDPYSYLKDNSIKDDAVASFFGSSA